MNMYNDKEFIPCRNCPTRNSEKASFKPGYYYETIDNYLCLRECDCHKKWREARELHRKLISANLIADYDFNNYRGTKSLQDLEALKEYAAHFEKYSYKTMLYIYGTNGTQKTSMVMAAGKEILSKGYNVQYVLMNNLLASLVEDFDKNSQEQKEALVKKWNECDLLIIDESFDKEKSVIYKSGYQVPFLDAFIRNRFEINKKPIIFISNHLPEEISTQGFSLSLQNLVQRSTNQSTLIFKDVYLDNANQIDRLGLFGRK